MARYFVGGFVSFLSFALGLMMQVLPHDAASNLCNWTPYPDRCRELLPSWFDQWAWLLPTSLLAIGVVILFWVPIRGLLLATRSNRYPAKMLFAWLALFACLTGAIWALSVIARGPNQKSAGLSLRAMGLNPPQGVDLRDEMVKGSMAISFLNLCNSDGKHTLNRRSWSPIPNGTTMKRRISLHGFYIAIENKSKTTTLRGARLVLDTVEGLGGRIFNEPLRCDRTGSASADIPPGGLDYFMLGEGSDASDAGFFSPKIISASEYDTIIAQADQRDAQMVGFHLIDEKQKRYQLLKNDGYRIRICAYADDSPPIRARFILNTRTRIELWLTAETWTS
jgi:hypothetical protein